MPRGVPITNEEEAAIKAALAKTAHASLIARESKGMWSYATVWRVAARAGVELTAGRETMGRQRLPPEQWAEIEKAVAASPEATQEELARQTGVSRSTVGRVMRARRHAAFTLAG